MYCILKHSDLTRRPERIDIFVSKIKENEIFKTKYGDAVIQISENLEDLKTQMQQKGFRRKFNSTKGSLQYPNDFYKTPELGGKGKGTGTKKEDYYFSLFKKDFYKLKEELNSESIKIFSQDGVLEITNIQNTPGTPKSDFHLLDTNGNEVFWISHKAGNTAKDFQQYGGLLELFNITNSNEIKKFIDKIEEKIRFPIFPKGQSFYMYPEDKDVILKGIYGKDYGKKYSRQNVNCLLQGRIKFIKKDDYFILDSEYTHYNGNIPTDEYTPIYFARYSSDRKNFIDKCRTMLVVEAIIKQRNSIRVF